MKVRCPRNPSSEKPVPGVYDFSLGSTPVHSVALMKIEMAWPGTPATETQDPAVHTVFAKAAESSDHILSDLDSCPEVGFTKGGRIHKEVDFQPEV